MNDTSQSQRGFTSEQATLSPASASIDAPFGGLIPARMPLSSGRLRACWVAVAVLVPQALTAGPSAAPAASPAVDPWSVATTAGVKTGYDSNVLLQDSGDQAGHEAWVNSLTAQFALTYQPSPLFKALLSYAPEFTFYEGETHENHLTHRGSLNLSGSGDDLTWELLNSVVRIEGDDLGPTFTRNGGTVLADVPAIGGVPLRDRRDAAIYKNSFKLTQTYGKMLVRPMASFYHHNFMTEQHRRDGSEPGFLGYENYVDRQEFGGGIDMGYEAWSKTWLVVGVRAGHQEQYELLGRSSPYSNDYYRILAGVEGTPVEWLKLNVLAGPDFREYDSTTPVGFDSDQLYFFVDATATITPTKVDTITLGVKRFMQPSYTSHSLYEDIVYEATYRRQLDSRFAVGAGFKAYHADWRPPVPRDEWVFTPSVSLSYTHSANLTAELAYSYDWAYSQWANTTEREFTRHLIFCGLKYAF
jgi:hypothetical protein